MRVSFIRKGTSSSGGFISDRYVIEEGTWLEGIDHLYEDLFLTEKIQFYGKTYKLLKKFFM